MAGNDSVTAIRGAALTFTDDPFHKPVEDCMRYETDAVIIMSEGVVSEFGPAGEVLPKVPDGVEVKTYDDVSIPE